MGSCLSAVLKRTSQPNKQTTRRPAYLKASKMGPAVPRRQVTGMRLAETMTRKVNQKQREKLDNLLKPHSTNLSSTATAASLSTSSGIEEVHTSGSTPESKVQYYLVTDRRNCSHMVPHLEHIQESSILRRRQVLGLAAQ